METEGFDLAIAFIDHKKSKVTYIQSFVTHKVCDTARSAYQDVTAGFDVGHAFAESNTAENSFDDNVGEIFAKTTEFTGDLDGHLAGVAENNAGSLRVSRKWRNQHDQSVLCFAEQK